MRIEQTPLAHSCYGRLTRLGKLDNGLTFRPPLPDTPLTVLQQINLPLVNDFHQAGEINFIAENQYHLALDLPVPIRILTRPLNSGPQRLVCAPGSVVDEQMEYFTPMVGLSVIKYQNSEPVGNNHQQIQQGWLKRYTPLFRFFNLAGATCFNNVPLEELMLLFAFLARLTPSERINRQVAGVLKDFDDNIVNALIDQTISKIDQLFISIRHDRAEEKFEILKRNLLMSRMAADYFQMADFVENPSIYGLSEALIDLRAVRSQSGNNFLAGTFMIHEIWPFMNFLLIRQSQLADFKTSASN